MLHIFLVAKIMKYFNSIYIILFLILIHFINIIATYTYQTNYPNVSRLPFFNQDLSAISNQFRPSMFSVMTFNTWQSGSNTFDGLQKIVKHLSLINPHIVALQETWSNVADEICQRLNSLSLGQDVWRRCRYGNFGQTHVITRLPVVIDYGPSDQLQNSGCKIQIRQFPLTFVDVWNVHLQWTDYGPYAVCNDDFVSMFGDTAEIWTKDILSKTEHKPDGRFYNVMNLFKHEPLASQLTSGGSIILVGDFNTPSHLDWIEVAKRVHCNVSFQWPVSMLLAAYGFRDSYRYVNANPVTMPGNTWSPVYKRHVTENGVITNKLEPQDRIDFIYYKGFDLKPISSRVYEGIVPVVPAPNHKFNDWPSDHAAVITDFALV